MTEEQVPVLIVGGGGAGLTASMLLARQGVEHLLISARPGTSDLPKAHVLNLRAMEILEDCGVADAIAARSTPAHHMAATAFYAGFAGPEGDYGHRLAQLESWGAGGENENWRAASACRQLNLPQIRLEPLMKEHAERLSPSSIRFNHELLGLEQDEDGVTALVRDNGSGDQYSVRCEYLLGADGGRRVAGQVGVEYEGLGVVTQTATLHVSADFSPWARDPDVLIRWIYSPQSGIMLVMVPMGPERWGPDSEEWVIHVNYPVDDPRAQSDDQVEADVRKAIGLPDVPMTIHKITRWSVDAVMASAFRAGRVFLLGDAAHLTPPFIGQGLGAGLRDADNLAWKIAEVLGGRADIALLESYEAERRPHARALVKKAVRIGWAMTGGQDRAATVRRVLLGAAVRSATIREALASTATPPLRRGAVGPAERLRVRGRVRTGALIPNAMVVSSDAAPVRLDRLLQGRTAVLTAGRPSAALVAQCRQRGVQLIRVTCGRQGTSVDFDWLEVALTDPAAGPWRALTGDPGRTVLVRPDGVVAALGTRGRLPVQAWPTRS
jgi:2-polyprenyl-6-methoxyphenol hydroxylase-like FAD-dependent oxidoreductase